MGRLIGSQRFVNRYSNLGNTAGAHIDTMPVVALSSEL